MVTAATSTRKRKQVESMDDSPPKRVTRARAARPLDEAVETLKTKKITTASARAAMASKPPAKATATTTSKRKTRTAGINNIEQQDVTDERVEVEEPKKTRGRAKKAADSTVLPSEPKITGRKAKAIVETDVVVKSTKPRARAKKNVEVIEDETDAIPVEIELSKALQKSTRSRAAIAKAKPDAPQKKTANTRKKVTFQDEKAQDKENAPEPSMKKPKSVEKSGITAKPIRKAPITRSTRGRRAVGSEATTTPAGQQGTVKPLSPKKVTQVAKSISSASSEDELCDKSPVRALARSPTRPPQVAACSEKSLAKSHSQQPPEPCSPTKSLAASLLSSPAKRPPPSPFKIALKDSPKRINLSTSTDQVQIVARSSPFKDTLKESPRKVNLGLMATQSLSSSSRSPFKSSLLQSPARRMSPVKARAIQSSEAIKDAAQPLDATCVNEGVSTFELPTLSPRKLFISPQRLELTYDSESVTDNIESTKLGAPQEPQGSPSPVRSAPNKITEPESPSKPFAKFGVVRSPAKGLRSKWTTTQDSDSEDELQSGPANMSPRKDRETSERNLSLEGFPARTAGNTPRMNLSEDAPSTVQTDAFSITPLALQLSTWCASSPEKSHALLDLSMNTPSAVQNTPAGNDLAFDQHSTLTKSTFFDDEMTLREQEPISILEDQEPDLPDDLMDLDTDPISQEKEFDAPQEVEQYGDENIIPMDPEICDVTVDEEAQLVLTTATPAKPFKLRPKEIHTVSKVPLRPADDDESPIRIPRKRSKSTSGPLGDVLDLSRPLIGCNNTSIATDSRNLLVSQEKEKSSPSRKVSFETSIINALLTPGKGVHSAATSPAKSVRKGDDAQILRGAVVHVDVHTSEGADASGIFVELLTQMGARCVKQWTWNPQTATRQVRDAPDSAEATPNSKVGITHVVFKDGSKRNLQKVRDARGLVVCVGVGWVLDCESENRWLDEAAYAVDTSTIPRGGHNRRKSMEPRSLSNVNGNLVSAETPGKGMAHGSPNKDFMNFSISSRRDSIRVPTRAALQTPATPTPVTYSNSEDMSSWGSPTTPYFLSKGAQLVQQTCPPKQTMQPLFPVSGRIEDQPDEALRQRLIMARRKSLQWAPKVGSPLGRAVSYGK